MTKKSSSKPKPRSKATKIKGRSPAAGKARARSKASRAAGTRRTKRGAGSKRRLRPGELDGLVIAYMRKREDDLPLGAVAVAKGIERSSGAVSNCLERQANSVDSPVRRAQDRPRAYDLKAQAAEKTVVSSEQRPAG